MTVTAVQDSPPPLVVNGVQIPTTTIGEFMLANGRRPASFITNFGHWHLRGDVAVAFASPVAHLEWFHDTGELVAFGQVPRLGHGEFEVSATHGLIDTFSAPFGGAGGRISPGADGTVREFFPAMVVDEGTRVAILAVVAHGPRVHELLWGWHLEHRHADGWNWLEHRLAATHSETRHHDPG